MSEPFPETAPGLLPGLRGSGPSDLAGAFQDRAGGRVALADDLALLVPDPADVEPAARARIFFGRTDQIWKNPASPPLYSAMSGISFSAPTGWRLSESRASMPVTTVDRLIRTPAPPVQVAVGPLPGEDQDDGCPPTAERRDGSATAQGTAR